jgi:hypothetical protein
MIGCSTTLDSIRVKYLLATVGLNISVYAESRAATALFLYTETLSFKRQTQEPWLPSITDGSYLQF